MRRAAFVLAVACTLGACGADQPSIRLRADVGKTLVYEARRVDDRPDSELGAGGVLDVTTRFQMKAVDAVRGRGGRYETAVLAVRVADAPQFGVRFDTDAEEDRESDPLGAHAVARELLGRHGELTIHERGGFGDVRPDAEVRARLKTWTEEHEGREVKLVAALLDQQLDGPRVVRGALDSPIQLLPDDPTPEPASTWTSTTPTPSPAGILVCAIDVTHVPQADGTVRLEGEGTFSLSEAAEGASVGFTSGTYSATLHYDPARGVILDYSEDSEMTFAVGADDRSITARWRRELKLVE